MPQPFRVVALIALSALISFGPVEARSSHGHSGGSHSSRSSSSHRTSPSYSGHSHSRHAKALPGVPRDSHGHVKRSESAKRDFEKQSGYPHGRPGYVVDHVVPLARGGADSPSNMQWQTKEDAKAKDKVELGQTPHARRSGGKRHWWSRHG